MKYPIIFLGLALVGSAIYFFSQPSHPPMDATVESPAQPTQTTKNHEIEPSLPTARAVPTPMAEKKLEPLYDRIRTLVNAGKITEAISILKAALEKDPNNTVALEALGMIYLSQENNPKKARPYFQKVIEINPDNEFSIARLIEVDGLLNQPQKSIQTLESIDRDASGHVPVQYALGDLYLKNGDPKRAIRYLESSLDSESHRSQTLPLLARAHKGRKQFGKATRYLQENRELLKERRKQLKEQGQPTKLINKELGITELELVETLAATGKIERAKRVFDSAVRHLGEDDPRVQRVRQMLHF